METTFNLSKINNKEITFYNVINARILDKKVGWIDLRDDIREEALEEFKRFLLSNCRANSKPARAIKNMSLSNLPQNCSFYDRLIIDRDGIQLIARQDYNEDIKYLKQQIIKHCY